MQAAGSSEAMSLQQLLTAPITRMFPRFLWTQQRLSAKSCVEISCQLFDRLQGATVAMKLPVQVHVVVQPDGWDAALYVLSRAPQQQVPVTHSSSSISVLEAVCPADRECEEVPAAALPTAAAGPGSKPLGPFCAFVSRANTDKLRLVKMKHDGKLDSYRSARGSSGAHDIVLFEQVGVCMLVHWSGGVMVERCRQLACDLLLCLHPLHCCSRAAVA
jgi:hypothetical protein